MREALEEAAQEVFDELGAGWSESIYHRALERELSERQIPFHSEGTIPVMYKGAPVGRRRPDLFVVPEEGGTIILELKAGSSSGSAQLAQYLDMTEADENLGYIRGGAVIRFNEEMEFEFIELGPRPNPDDKNRNFRLAVWSEPED
jgi:GxxExxY protein